ncbi:FERM, ARHGEF and pleckstrin domain-containing protein 1-like [Lampetra fluviatilis]
MGEIEGTYRRVDPAEAARGKPTPVRATRSDESAAETHGNLLPITVRLLDDTEKIFDVPPKAEGIALLTTVYKHLNLVESDYFGLELEPYPKCGFTVWLDSQKPIAKQVKKPKNVVFKLGVKFFSEDSSQLQEEITRYQFALQVRQDLLAGRLVASEMSSSLMAACLLQADVSDYEEQRSSQQLREVQYLPNQEVLANRILDYHRQFAGLSPAEADVQLLEIARRQDTYGLRLHQAYDKEGASINLAVGYSGVSVFQNTTKINTFNWAKIRKLSFKRKYFLVKFHPDIEGNYQDTLEFSMKGRDACKAFWKGCVESHAFFRLQDPPRPKPKSVLFSRGSSFRYSGRTQKQVSMYVRDHGSRRVQFERRSTKMRSSQSHRDIPANPPQLTAEPPKQSASFSEGESGGHVWDPVSLILAKEGSLPPKQLETTSDQLPSPTGRVGTAQDGGVATQGLADAGHGGLPPAVVGNGRGGGASSNAEGSDVENEYDLATGRVAAPLTPEQRFGGEKATSDELSPLRFINGGGRAVERLDSDGNSVNLGNSNSNLVEEFFDDDPADILFHGGQTPSEPAGSAEGDAFRLCGHQVALTALAMEDSGEGFDPERNVGNGERLNLDVHATPGEYFLKDKTTASGFAVGTDSRAMLRHAFRHLDDTDPRILSLDGTYNSGRVPESDLFLDLNAVECNRAHNLGAVPNEFYSVADHTMDSAASDSLPGEPVSPGVEQLVCSTPVKPLNPPALPASAYENADGQLGRLAENSSSSSGSSSSSSESESSNSDSELVVDERADASSSGLVIGNPLTLPPISCPVLRNRIAYLDVPCNYDSDECDGGSINLSDEESGGPVGKRHGLKYQGPDVLVSRPRPPGDPQTEPWRVVSQAVAVVASTSPLPPSPTGTGAATEPAAAARVEEEEEARKKRCPADKAYFIAKEICTTERTHIKDLEVITVWFSSFLGQESPMSKELSSKLFSSFQPLSDFHRTFLKEVETRLTLWEGKSNAHLKGDHEKIGDIMLKNMQLLKRLVWPLCGMEQLLRGLESEVQASHKLADACRTFELQRVCHLPLGGFLLRPLQRPLHYRLLLERLCKHHAPDHFALRFQFNDMLVYTSKALTTNNQFKVHGKMQLSTLKITASEREFSIPCSFTLSTPQKHVVVAANSPEEMDKWVEDVTLAARRAADDTVDHATAGHSPCRETDIVESHIYSSDDQEDSAEDEAASPRSPHGASSERLSVHQQTSSTVQVCCHRQTSVSLLDISRAAENQLSGYLLRKFKNNSGWQKLWVVFTNFCLFFYKTHQDNFPLASLPVLGYSITLPSESDGILKDYVFKLQFKSHIYFFRAESEYTFERWMEVIRSATSSSARTRLLSRKDSHFT